MLRAYMNKHEDLSMRHDTSVRVKNPGEDDDEESKEDEFARVINDDKKDDDWKPKGDNSLRVGYAFTNPYNEQVAPLSISKKGS
jgi:hypothetical protein